MITDTQVLRGLIELVVVTVLANLMFYWGVICPALYRNGAQFPTGLMPWRYFHDLHGYRLILAAEGKPTNRYYVILFLTWFNILLIIGVAGYALALTAESSPSRRL